MKSKHHDKKQYKSFGVIPIVVLLLAGFVVGFIASNIKDDIFFNPIELKYADGTSLSAEDQQALAQAGEDFPFLCDALGCDGTTPTQQIPTPECTSNSQCTDNIFCNGVEYCSSEKCVKPNQNPCGTGYTCDETNDKCIVASGTTSPSVSTAGLVAKYSFENGATDSSGNNNHGTVVGATSVAGKKGNALSFDGADDYIELWTSTATPGPFAMSNAMTVAGYVKFDTVSGTQTVIARGPTASSVPYEVWNLAVVNGAPRFRVSNGAKFLGFSSPTKLNTGVWYHLTGVFDGKQVKLYVNGELAGQSAIETTVFTIHDPNNGARRETAVGADRDNKPPRNYLNGDLDEVSLSDRALSQAEVKALMNN